MAWINNLAGKAEHILEEINKNAATVLSRPQDNNDGSINLPQNKEDKNDTFVTQNEALSSYESNMSKSDANDFYCEDDISESVETCYNNSIISSGIENNFSNFLLLDFPIEINGISCNDGNLDLTSSKSSVDEQQANEKVALQSEVLQERDDAFPELFCSFKERQQYLEKELSISQERYYELLKEFEEYKQKAQLILHQKEKTIADLETLNSETNERETEECILDEFRTLKTANEELRHQLSLLQSEIEVQRSYVLQNENEKDTMIASLTIALEREKLINSNLNEECNLKTQELKRTVSKLRNFEHENEILKKDLLNEQKRIEELSRCSSQDQDVTSKINSLTEALVAKQSRLEIVTAEKNSLKIQLEKLHGDFEELRSRTMTPDVKINIFKGDNSSSIPRFLVPSSFDGIISRKVKAVYGKLDNVSAKTGSLLKKSPVFRVIIFCYFACLQVWTMFLLLHCAPK